MGAARCESTYQNRDTHARPLGPIRRCTREVGHPVDNGGGDGWRELHQWGGRGRMVRWPDVAAEPKAADRG